MEITLEFAEVSSLLTSLTALCLYLVAALHVSSYAVAAILGWAFDGSLRHWIFYAWTRASGGGTTFDEVVALSKTELDIRIALHMPYFAAGVLGCPTCMSWWLGLICQVPLIFAWLIVDQYLWPALLSILPIAAAAASRKGLSTFKKS